MNTEGLTIFNAYLENAPKSIVKSMKKLQKGAFEYCLILYNSNFK